MFIDRIVNRLSLTPVDTTSGSTSPEKPTILVAEDEHLLARLLNRILQKDYRVTVVSNGQEALDALQTNSGGFDLLLTDIDMPVMGGLELIKAIREGKTPLFKGAIFVMSGRIGTYEAALDALEVPAKARTEKPFDPGTLKTSLHEAIPAHRNC